jgi:hypothetical protein
LLASLNDVKGHTLDQVKENHLAKFVASQKVGSIPSKFQAVNGASNGKHFNLLKKYERRKTCIRFFN